MIYNFIKTIFILYFDIDYAQAENKLMSRNIIPIELWYPMHPPASEYATKALNRATVIIRILMIGVQLESWMSGGQKIIYII